MASVRSLGFRTDVMLRRMAGATVEEREGFIVVRTTANPTFYWGNFLLFPQPPEAGAPERWLRAFEAEFPEAAHVAIGVDGVDGALGAAEELRALGLTEERSVVLTAQVLATPRPADPTFDLRVLRTDEEWHQPVEFRESVDEDDSAGHREFVERRVAEFRALTEAGRGVYLGAFVDGILRAGLGLFAADGLARYQNVETHPDFRGRGLASTLIVEAARLVREQQRVEQFVIVADPSYFAVDIYRRLGFRDAEQQVQWLRPPRSVG